MMAINISWHGLDNKIWSNFLKKYTNRKFLMNRRFEKIILKNVTIEKFKKFMIILVKIMFGFL